MRITATPGYAVGDAPTAVSPTGVKLSLLFLATPIIPQGASIRFVSVKMKVLRFMAERQLAGNLV